MHPKDAEGIADSVDPDQIWSVLFVQICLSEKLGSFGTFIILAFSLLSLDSSQ